MDMSLRKLREMVKEAWSASVHGVTVRHDIVTDSKETMKKKAWGFRVKHLPAMRETGVRSLHWEDTLEKEMATHSSTLAWKIPCTEEPGRLQSLGLQRVGHAANIT